MFVYFQILGFLVWRAYVINLMTNKILMNYRTELIIFTYFYSVFFVVENFIPGLLLSLSLSSYLLRIINWVWISKKRSVSWWVLGQLDGFKWCISVDEFYKFIKIYKILILKIKTAHDDRRKRNCKKFHLIRLVFGLCGETSNEKAGWKKKFKFKEFFNEKWLNLFNG